MLAEAERVAWAFRQAGTAFFDHAPARPGDPAETAGTLRWIGAEFGIPDIARRGLPAVAAAVAAEDRARFLDLFAPDRVPPCGGEFRLPGPDGRGTVLRCHVAAAPGDSPGRRSGVMHDVTPRRRSEDRLGSAMREREMLLAVIDACPISITVGDARRPGTPLVYVNDTFEALTGYGRAETTGVTCGFLQGPETDAAAVQTLRSALARGAQAEVRLLNYRKDGSTFLNQVTVAPIRDRHGELVAFLGLQRDVTEEARQAEAERQRQRIEALGRMMGGVAHEISNLLQPIILATEDLIAGEDRDGAPAGLQLILDCALDARRIIGDLLAFSRPGAARAETLDAAELLDKAMAILRQAVGPEITIDASGCAPGLRVRADRARFTQVLLNLALNAAAAMRGKGRIGIVVTAEASSEGGGSRIRIGVSDTGCGMDRTTAERAFEPFFTTRPVGEGTGLGLSVAYGLVKEMGGEIVLDSVPGRGTTVSILLPQYPAFLDERTPGPWP